MDVNDPLQVAAGAAHGFQVFQCQQCAEAIKAALRAAGHSGEVIELRGGAGRDFMICFSYDGGQATITQTGWHTGVRVGEVVFDNLHPDGLPFEDWVKDFDALGGVVLHSLETF